jgi:uncharacterized protein YdeI (BOF family)
MKKKLIIALSLPVLGFFIAGCASQSVNNGLSLSGYKAFEVIAVSNETGKTFDSDVTAEMTKHIISKLEQEGFNVTDTSGKTIIIRSSLISYQTRTGTATCTVKSVLIDKDTRKVLGEFVTTSSVSAGGLSQLGLETGQAILEMAAGDIVSRIEGKIRVNK